MDKVWTILYVLLFIVIVFALNLEGLAFIILVIDQTLDVMKDKKQEEQMKKLEDFRKKFNNLYKKEVFEASKS